MNVLGLQSGLVITKYMRISIIWRPLVFKGIDIRRVAVLLLHENTYYYQGNHVAIERRRDGNRP